MNKEFFLTKKFITTGLLVLFSVFFLGYFSQVEKVNPVFQTFLVSVTFFLVVPVLYCKIVLKESLSSLGWEQGKFWPGVFIGIVSVILGLSIIVALSYFTSFKEYFILPASVKTNFLSFVIYEALLIPFTVLLYEVFFRGLVQRLWLNSLGLIGVLLQAGFFIGLLVLSSDLSWQRVPALIFAPLSGLIVYYSGSLWYAWAASFLFFFLTDIFLLVSH
jgi:membrane protease YdiL (CAAX protease family)